MLRIVRYAAVALLLALTMGCSDDCYTAPPESLYGAAFQKLVEEPERDVESRWLPPGKYAMYGDFWHANGPASHSTCSYSLWFDATACSWVLAVLGADGYDEECELLTSQDCPGFAELGEPLRPEATAEPAPVVSEERQDACGDSAPMFAFGVPRGGTLQCGSRTCVSYYSGGHCGYTLCPEQPDCKWEVVQVGGEGADYPSKCPGQEWPVMYEDGKQPPVPTCDGNPPATAYGVEYDATEYGATGAPCGRYGKSKICEYLACLDLDSCEWLLSELKTNHIGNRTECAGWGKQGMPVSP